MEKTKYWKITQINNETGLDEEVNNRVIDLNAFFMNRNEGIESYLWKLEKLTKKEFEETEK